MKRLMLYSGAIFVIACIIAHVAVQWPVEERPNSIHLTPRQMARFSLVVSLANSNDTYYLPAGTYTLSDIAFIPSGVTVRGKGSDKTVLYYRTVIDVTNTPTTVIEGEKRGEK